MELWNIMSGLKKIFIVNEMRPILKNNKIINVLY